MEWYNVLIHSQEVEGLIMYMIEVWSEFEGDESQMWAGQVLAAFARKTDEYKLFAYTHGTNGGYEHAAIGPISSDLSELVAMSGIYRLAKKSFSVDKRMVLCNARVEIYELGNPLGKPTVEVSIVRTPKATNNANILTNPGGDYICESVNGNLSGINARRSDTPEYVEAAIVDILASRTNTTTMQKRWNELTSGDDFDDFLLGKF